MAEIPWRHPVDTTFLEREKTPVNNSLGVVLGAAEMIRDYALDRLPEDPAFVKAFAHVVAYLSHFSGTLTENPWTPRDPKPFEAFMLGEPPQYALPERLLETFEMNVQRIIQTCSQPGFSQKRIVTDPYLPDAPITGESYLVGVITPYMVRSFQQLAMPVGF